MQFEQSPHQLHLATQAEVSDLVSSRNVTGMEECSMTTHRHPEGTKVLANSSLELAKHIPTLWGMDCGINKLGHAGARFRAGAPEIAHRCCGMQGKFSHSCGILTSKTWSRTRC